MSRVDLVRAVHAEWARGDFRGPVDRFDEAVTYTTFAAEGDALVFRGRDQMIAWHRDFFANWRSFRIEADEIREMGDKVLVLGRQYAEGRDSGVSIDMPVFSVWSFRGDRVIALLFTRSREEALSAAGRRG